MSIPTTLVAPSRCAAIEKRPLPQPTSRKLFPAKLFFSNSDCNDWQACSKRWRSIRRFENSPQLDPKSNILNIIARGISSTKPRISATPRASFHDLLCRGRVRRSVAEPQPVETNHLTSDSPASALDSILEVLS